MTLFRSHRRTSSILNSTQNISIHPTLEGPNPLVSGDPLFHVPSPSVPVIGPRDDLYMDPFTHPGLTPPDTDGQDPKPPKREVRRRLRTCVCDPVADAILPSTDGSLNNGRTPETEGRWGIDDPSSCSGWQRKIGDFWKSPVVISSTCSVGHAPFPVNVSSGEVRRRKSLEYT